MEYLFNSEVEYTKHSLCIYLLICYNVQWKPHYSGAQKFGPKNEVTLLMKLESTLELYLGPTRGGHYNKVVLLQWWPLSEISL